MRNASAFLGKTLAMKAMRPFFLPSLQLLTGVLLGTGSWSMEAAEGMKGARAVLQTVAEQSGRKAEAAPASDAGRLRAELQAFGNESSALGPAEAAKQWLAFVERFLALPRQERTDHGSEQGVSAQLLLAALPRPDSWPELAKLVAARPAPRKGSELQESGLRLMAAALTSDSATRDKEIQALQARAEKAPRSDMYILRNVFEQLNERILEAADDPDAVLQALDRRLARSGSDRSPRTVRIPNLLTLVGEEKAEAFLRRALTTNQVILSFDNSGATAALARRLALELIEQLKAPQWGLVNSLDSIELFEALDKKFTKPNVPSAGVLNLPRDFGTGDYSRTQAETYYFLGLIGKGRAKDAVAVAQRLATEGRPHLPDEALKSMERAGYTKALDDFFFELMTQDPSLPFWTEYVPLAAKAGRTDRMLKLARETANDEKLTKRKRASIHQNLFRALLADGQVDEGVAELKRLLAAEPSSSPYAEARHGNLAIILARLGILLKKPEWTEEGILAARRSLTNAPREGSGWMDESVPETLASLLFDLGRSAEAEGILAEALAQTVRASAANQDRFGNNDKPAQLLGAMASLYHRANRPADVVALLDAAPYWGAPDLAQLLDTEMSLALGGFSMRMQVRPAAETLPIAHVAASALAALNRAAEARALNDAVLNGHPGFDKAYELAVQLHGESALDYLDQLYSRDQFEERPLIWKAKVLADRKDYAAAEAVVRRAIAIDPSDGEQGPGDRMRAYAVLADIRAGQGDEKEAVFLRGVVKAIRLSEEADQFYAVGLLKRAVSMYQESLQSFANAYCIQSRLAIQLSELGLHDQAEEHYRRAYELMPDSFGRVESHCFGCEQAFAGARAQNLAETIFTELAAKQPKKPQVHYLLGYLRGEQGRHAEAVPHFKTAVALDPEYLNAWQKLLGASLHVRMAPSERDQIVFNILRLDPLQRHAYLSWTQVADLRGLWLAIDAANKRQPQKPQTLYVLTASKAQLEKLPEAQAPRVTRLRFSEMDGGREQTPGAAIAQTAMVRIATELMSHTSGEDE
jgi:tetratricopeptide (TPR) repeat protein